MSQANTSYKVRMEVCVRALLGEGERAFTKAMLAERMGVKQTRSFHNRLAELEAAHVIESWRFESERGGYPIAYSRPGDWVNGVPIWKQREGVETNYPDIGGQS